MKTTLTVAGFAVCMGLAAVACTHWQAFAQGDALLLPSELAVNPEKYDGKHVRVRGYVVLGPETRNIADSKAAYESGRGACLGLDGPEKMFTSFHQRYSRRISGVFRKNLCGDRDVCLYWCTASGIELDKDSKP